ncbi:hypothetical protein ACPPVO_34745 [Dactylosporangium sp. McL0621]|uniref:hypothetical protein n=1 Tax=Dactylosporangium sp. McL0621 TaxID=3415678 RepID=UPI003CF42329
MRVLARSTTWLAYARQLPGRHPVLVDVALAGVMATVSLMLGTGVRDMDLPDYTLTCPITP